MIIWEEFVMMMENTVKMTPTMILMKLDEGVLHMRKEGDGEDVDDLQDSMGSSAVQGASAKIVDVNVLRGLMSIY